MKKMYLIIALMLLCGIDASAYYPKTVNVQTTGTLSTLISSTEKNKITHLKVSGKIDGGDILFIREMAGRDFNMNATSGQLNFLDLKDAEIVSSNTPYVHYMERSYCAFDDELGDFMFMSTKLDTVYAPKSAISVDKYCFFNSNLNCFSNSSIKKYAEYAFAACPGKKLEYFGCNVVTSIGAFCFQSSGLTGTVTIGPTISTIGVGAFYACKNISKFEVYETNTNFTADGVALYSKSELISYPSGNPSLNYRAVKNIGERAFSACQTLKEVTTSSDVTKVGNFAFGDCAALESVKLGINVTSIGASAFLRCKNLNALHLLHQGMIGSESSQLEGVPSTCKLYVNNVSTVLANYSSDAIWSKYTIIPECVFKNDAGQYNDMPKIPYLTAMTVIGGITPQGFKNLRWNAGIDTLGRRTDGMLTYLDLEDATFIKDTGNNYYYKDFYIDNPFLFGRTYIPPFAFYFSKLEEVILPYEDFLISSCAFSASPLKRIYFPHAFLGIETTEGKYDFGIFSGCPLEEISFADGEKSLFGVLFDVDNGGLYSLYYDEVGKARNLLLYPPKRAYTDSYKLHSDCIRIEEFAFYDCNNIGTLDAENVKDVCYRAFMWSGMKSINLSRSIRFVGKDAFSCCKNLEEIRIENNLSTKGYKYQVIDGVLFSWDAWRPSDLDTLKLFPQAKSTEYHIPETCGIIGGEAFNDNENIRTVYIPSSVKSIEAGAFDIESHVQSLSKIYCSWNTPCSVTEAVFGDLDKSSVMLYVPYGTMSNYKASNVWKEFPMQEWSGVKAVNTDAVRVFAEGSEVRVQGLADGSPLSVADLDGRIVYSGAATSGNMTITLPAAGMYIVRANGKSYKVISR
jgi:hypothetical protein